LKINQGDVYSIKNISTKCAIAIKFEEDDNYYVYVNYSYKPKNLGEFIGDLNLNNIIQFGTIYYNYWDENLEYKNIEFYDVDNKLILEMLFDNMNLENIYNDAEKGYMSERYADKIDISVNIPLLGYKNIGMSLTDKGYLLTNILDTGKGFYIGEDKVQEFVNVIKKNYTGYQIIHVFGENTEQTVNETIENVNKVQNTTTVELIERKEDK